MNEDRTIDISGLDKASVLMALYAAAKPQGMGYLQFTPGFLERSVAEDLLKHDTYFDYLRGRVMKVNLAGDRLDPWLYDRDNGPNAAMKALQRAELIRTEPTT